MERVGGRGTGRRRGRMLRLMRLDRRWSREREGGIKKVKLDGE